MKWKTKEGKVMDVKEMTDSHLLNALRMIEKALEKDPGEEIYIGESAYAEAAVFQENSYNDILREYLQKTARGFKREMKRRLSLIKENP